MPAASASSGNPNKPIPEPQSIVVAVVAVVAVVTAATPGSARTPRRLEKGWGVRSIGVGVTVPSISPSGAQGGRAGAIVLVLVSGPGPVPPRDPRPRCGGDIIIIFDIMVFLAREGEGGAEDKSPGRSGGEECARRVPENM